MKKFVSIFMALVVAFTMGPNMVVRAQDECFGEACGLGPDAPQVQGNASLTGWAWCKENPKDCATYLGETAWKKTKRKALAAWKKTKRFGGKAKDGIVDVADVIRNHNYTQTWEDIKNYNYTQGFETAKENVKWVASEVSDKWSDTVSPWLSEKADDAVKFEKQIEDFYNYDLNEQPKWTFWTLMTSAGVGVLTMGTWAFNLITCCGCGRCRLRMP